jgi:hypothetical protein
MAAPKYPASLDTDFATQAGNNPSDAYATALGVIPSIEKALGIPNSTDKTSLDYVVRTRNRAAVTVAYSATPAIDASLGSLFVIAPTDTVAFVIQAPTNGVAGDRITIEILNSSSVAIGATTFAGGYKSAGAVTAPANTKSRLVSFVYDGANWVETARSAADIG